MAVKEGNKVKVDYTGTLEDGTVFDSSTQGDHSHPIEFEVGAKQVVPGFEKAVLGMELNEEKDITLTPEDAYGDHNPELIKAFPKDKLPEGAKEGMMLGMHLENGHQVPAKIVSISDDEFKLDLNPPLAGKVLNFKIKVVEIN